MIHSMSASRASRVCMVGEALQHVDADRPLAREAVAGVRIIAAVPPFTAATVTTPGGGASGKTSSPERRRPAPGPYRVGAGFQEKRLEDAYWPKRTPCLRRLARPSWSSAFTSSEILAQRLDEAKGDAARHAREALARGARRAAGRAPRSCGRSTWPSRRLTRSATADRHPRDWKGDLRSVGPGDELADACSPHISPPVVTSIWRSGRL